MKAPDLSVRPQPFPDPRISLYEQRIQQQDRELADLRAVNNRLVHDVEREQKVKVWPIALVCKHAARGCPGALALDPVPRDEATVWKVAVALGWSGEHECPRHR